MSGLDELRDPAAIAEARMALLKAEKRAKTEAEAERLRALADAQDAEDQAFVAEVNGAMGPAKPVRAAQAAVAEAKQSHEEALADLKLAEWHVEKARAAIPRLVKRKVSGEDITKDDVLEAHADCTQAEQIASFRAVVVANRAPMIEEAEAAHRAAIATSYEPVLQRGIDLRIQAAAMADKARSPLPGRSDEAALDAARGLVERANRIINHACGHGLRVPSVEGGLSTTWPVTEAAERRRWKRSAPEVAT